jgi:hypothetical protein
MTLRRSARNVAVMLATFNLVFPVSLLQASDRTAPNNAVRSNEYRSHITDIALEKGGRFTGHVLDVQGRPSVDFKVVAVQNGEQIDTVSTDSRGRFQISHLRGGMFQLTAGPHTYLCRGWGARYGSAGRGEAAADRSAGCCGARSAPV